MIRRLVLLLGSFLVLNLTGCALLSLVVLPIQLLFSLLSSLGTAAGGAVGIVYAEPIEGPPAVVQRVGESAWLVDGLSPRAPCRIVCSAPGCEPRTYDWPRDFEGRGENVTVRLEPKR
jgi:hypothetical protein